MALFISEIGCKMKFTAMASTLGQMGVFMKENGLKTRSMVKVNSHSPMVRPIKVSIEMTRKLDTVFILN